MVRRIEAFIQQYHMIQSGDAIVAGVSGGADSVCLLFVLQELRKRIPFSLLVVHVNHGIRRDAKEDEKYVERLCQAWQIPFFAVHEDIPRIAAAQGISEEEAGRNVRYRAFEEVLQKEAQAEWKENRAKIAVAHNANDRAETMLFHLFRGTGIKGLCSIQPVRERIIRPLLCVERYEIETFLMEKGIDYCIDSTNQEDAYTRNKIRNHLFPYITENISASAVEHMNHTADLLGEARDYLNRQSREAYSRCMVAEAENTIVIDVDSLTSEETFLQGQVLLEIMEKLLPGRKDIGAVHIQAIRGLLDTCGSKSVNLPFELRAIKEYNRLTIGKVPKEGTKKEIPGQESAGRITVSIPGTYSLKGLGELDFSVFSREKDALIPQNQYTKWFDYDKIEKSLIVRRRQTGDYLTINEALSAKSLKEYLINEKIPKSQRDDLWILAEENHVLWVIGHRISTKYKIDENTKRILQVQLRGGATWQSV